MKVDATRAKALVSQLQAVSERVAKAASGRNVGLSYSTTNAEEVEIGFMTRCDFCSAVKQLEADVSIGSTGSCL